MYKVSDAYKTAMHDRVQRFRVTGTIGDVAFTDENILAGSLSITNQCSDSDTVGIGQVYVGEMNCTFLNTGIDRYSWPDKEITINFGQLLEDNTWEDIPLGVFTVSEAEWTSSGIVVKAYDHMAKLDKTCSDLGTNATAYQLAKHACAVCKVSLGTTQEEFAKFANGSRTLACHTENDIETYRDLMSWLGQTTGCFVTADRDGSIVFRQYTKTVVDTIDDENRFTGCSFSDFETRYTGLSVVNIDEETTSYYSVTPDNALTYNLGSNPFLQMGVGASVSTIRKEVLNALAVIDYVPFKATCLGNPAYDLGDVLSFTNGIADSTKLYCITKYTWNYNKDYSMEGVGKNPALANARSKSDKNISGLMSRTSSEEVFKFTVLRNGADVTVADGENKSVLFARYIVTQPSHVRFNIEILLTAETTEAEDGISDLVATVTYYSDGAEITDRHPVETWQDGKHILTLQYDVDLTDATVHTFDVWLSCAGGSATIAAFDAYEVISSSGLAADNQWEGTFIGEDGNQYIVINGQAHKVPNEIIVARNPNKTAYRTDASIDYTGCVIEAVYGDGSHVDITSDCTFNPSSGTAFDPETDTYVEVEYEIWTMKYSTGFDLEHVAINEIEVQSNPTKTTYKTGESIDYSGLKVVAVYINGSTEDITSQCSFSPAAGDAFDGEKDTYVNVTFSSQGESYETGFDLTWDQVSEIQVASNPAKTVYRTGESIDYTGLKVNAVYAESGAVDVTDSVTITPASGTAFDGESMTSVEISYTSDGQEFTASVDLTWDQITEIKVTAEPSTKAYRTGAAISYSGIKVVAVYSESGEEDVTSEVTFNPAEGTAYPGGD